MNRVKPTSILIMLLVLFTSSATALSFDFYDEFVHSQPIDATAPDRDTHFEALLDFPEGGITANYPSGVIFEYDDVQANITTFEITLKGIHDNSEQNIDIFLNLNSVWVCVAAFNVDYGAPFLLTLDLVNNNLRYDRLNYADEIVSTEYSTIHDVSMNSFIDINSFKVGYGCHFNHESTSVFLEGTYPPVVPIPEPATIILFLSGLIKLLHCYRK